MPSCSVSFNPDTDIPDLSSKTIIVTGGNSGVGKESVLQLSKHKPGKLYLAARSKAKFDTAVADITKAVPDANIHFLELDLASFSSVKRASETVLASNDRLDVLINNAGVMATPPGLTEDGYENQFGTNHMGHALLTKLLMPLLRKTAGENSSDVRIVNLTSGGERLAPKGGFLPEKCTTDMADYHSYTRYGQSKLANVLFTKELAKRYPTITSTAVHPGRVRTNLLNGFFEDISLTSVFQHTIDYFIMMPVEKGALTQLWTAVGTKEKVKSGAYYSPIGKEGGESGLAKDVKLAERLWTWQEAEFQKLGY